MPGEKQEDLLSMTFDREQTALVRSEAILEGCSEEDIVKRALSLYELAAPEMRTGGLLAVIRKNDLDDPYVADDSSPPSIPKGQVRFDVIEWKSEEDQE